MRFLSRILRIAGLGRLALLAGLHAANPVSTSSPLQLTPDALELGRQAQQQVIEKDVTLRNTGEAPLTILKVNADCGCTTSELKDNHLAPGASTTLRVRFETRAYTGIVHRRVQISTDAGARTLPLSVEVVPYPDWEISPLPVMLPPSRDGQSVQTKLTIRRRKADGARIVEATTNFPWLEASLEPVSTDGSQAVSLQKTPAAPAGTHSVILTLKTSDPAVPVLTVTVLVPVASGLRVTPNPILLPRTLAGEETSTTFRVIGWRAATPPHVQSDRGTLTALGEAEGDYTYQLKWTSATAGTHVGTVKILNGDKTELEIPVIHHVSETAPAKN